MQDEIHVDISYHLLINAINLDHSVCNFTCAAAVEDAAPILKLCPEYWLQSRCAADRARLTPAMN